VRSNVLGGGDPAKIVNPDNLDTQGANHVCRALPFGDRATPNGTIGWPYNETTQQSLEPGLRPLSAFYTDGRGVVARWKDRRGHQPVPGVLQVVEAPRTRTSGALQRPCQRPDVHDLEQRAVLDQVQYGKPSPSTTHVEDDTLCLSLPTPTHGGDTSADFTTYPNGPWWADYTKHRDCHQGTSSRRHEKPSDAPERIMGCSRCTQCHMAKTQGARAALALHGLPLEAIPPRRRLLQAQGGMPNFLCGLSCPRYAL